MPRRRRSTSRRCPPRSSRTPRTRARVDGHARRRVGLTARLEAREVAHDARRVIARLEPRVGVEARGARPGRPSWRTPARTGRAAASTRVGLDLDARGGVVPAEAEERVARARQRVVARRSPAGAARRAAPAGAVERDDRPWACRSARRAGPRRCRRRPGASPGGRGRSRAARRSPGPPGPRAPRPATARSTSLRRVQSSSTLGGDGAGLVVARGEQQREREVRLLEAAGSVDARREPEGHVLARGPGGRAARDLRERARAGAARPPDLREPGADERAVVAVERRDVADGADGDEVEPAPHVELDAELARERPRRSRARARPRRAPCTGSRSSGRCGFRNARAGSGSSGTRWWSMTMASTPARRTPSRRSWSLEPQSHVTRSVAPVAEHARERRARKAVAAVEPVGQERHDLGAERRAARR